MPDFKSRIRTLFSGLGYEKNEEPLFMAGGPDKYYRILNYVLIIASFIIGAYTTFIIFKRQRIGIGILLYGANQIGVISMTLAIVCITGSAALRTRLPFFAPVLIPIILFVVNCTEFFRLGFGDGFSCLWVFVIPPLTYFIAGRKIGFCISLAIFVAILIFIFFPRLSIYYYSKEKTQRIITVYLVFFFTAHIYEYIRNSKEKTLKKLNKLLKAERDEFVIMKDSLRTSLFLIDKDLIIQDHYSRLLEDTLGVSNLSGRKFTDLLASSLTGAEISTISDFFDMVLERRFDADMLDDINPLQELNYTSNEGGAPKTLRCAFAPIDRASGETVILCNIEDITAKVELQKQFQREEAKHQEEMNTLFEVLQIAPEVFNDFIEDAEYEFETINNILKNSRVSSKGTLATIFQSIHAIKANSIILGLNNYSQKLHEIESYVKSLQSKADVAFDDMLRLTVRIESVMGDKDNFRKSVEKIKAFSIDGVRKNAADILLENLNRTAERAAASSGKKVEMDTSGIDAAAIESAPRRLVKEVLLQLVRNAVFHGIETPDERLEKGKKESGFVAVSVKLENERVHIKLQDDGKGLDFEKIRQRAEQMHLIRKNEKIEDKNRIYQAIFIPGFSTAGSEGIYAGRGVGLDLVRSRIKEHNGTIKIQTEAGKGSIFHIFLPLQNSGEDN